MFTQPTPTATAPLPPGSPPGSLEDPAYIRALCKNFIREGIELSHRIIEETKTNPRFNADHATRAYARVARAMHRTILLLKRLDNPPRKSPKRTSPKDRETVERDESFEHDRGPEIGNQPTPDVIAAIQRDLGQVQKSHPKHSAGRTSEPHAAPTEPPQEPEAPPSPSPASAGEGGGEGASAPAAPPQKPEAPSSPSPALAGFGREADEGRGEGASPPQKPPPDG